ncbi:toprim domain-containing protein [Deinococcus sp.]|uniref:toprim domain-containing protein n=1 Tax=Deinococcus sp. TaxID=47478 RepID=UPI0025DF5BFD|nr:toprim domain-containing protein [Deinococcus sp.]
MSAMLDFYRDELRNRPVMTDLLAQAGIEVPPGRYIRCPLYQDNNPSTYVYAESVCDYGDDNKSYDLLAVARDWMGLQLDQAIALIAQLAGIDTPIRFDGQVRPVTFRPIIHTARTDPNDYAHLAMQAEAAYQALESDASHAALSYLRSRGLNESPFVYRLGVADSSVLGRLPHRIWRDMITLPTWHDGSLLALKGRNLLGKGEGREMRNLAGAATAPYGLSLLGDGAVLAVEGEMDVLSVWEAFEGQVNVVGIPGATHWPKLQHPALTGRKLYLCLDLDEAGQKAAGHAQRWAADEGRALHVLPGISDKNDLLLQRGPAHLRALLTGATTAASRRTQRRLRFQDSA